ncbi:hypothetical protein OF83DRAFT_1127047 [Amylostereum chailletii]|nr:hypothetical protein OF83DRAFT_1127047 [Amylostereum chailletii]
MAHISTQNGIILVPTTPQPRAPSLDPPDFQHHSPASEHSPGPQITVHEFLTRTSKPPGSTYASKRRRIVDLQEQNEPIHPTWTILDVSSPSCTERVSESSSTRSSSFSSSLPPSKAGKHPKRPPPMAKSVAQRMLRAAVCSGVQLPDAAPGDRRPLRFTIPNKFSTPPKRRPALSLQKAIKRPHPAAPMKTGPGTEADKAPYLSVHGCDPITAYSGGRRDTKRDRMTHTGRRFGQPSARSNYQPLVFIALAEHERARRSRTGVLAPAVEDIPLPHKTVSPIQSPSPHPSPHGKGPRTSQRHSVSRRRSSLVRRPGSRRHTLNNSSEDIRQPESRPLRNLASLLGAFMETARVAARDQEVGAEGA